MLKQVIQLEHKIADKVITLTCTADAALDHVKDALFQFTKYVGGIEDQVKAQQAAAKEKADAEAAAKPAEAAPEVLPVS